jgi:hypothetical protein
MSHKATAWAFSQKVPALQKLVLIMLADRHNADTGRCDPSLSKIADDCGLSRNSIIRNLKALADAGLIRIIRRVKPADETSGTIQGRNFYVLAFDNYAPQSALESGEYFDEVPAQTRGVVSNRDQGSATQALGVVPNSNPNQEVEPVREPSFVETSVSTPPPVGASTKKSKTKDPYAALIRDDLFPYYCQRAERNPALYTLTKTRLEKGVLRLEECVRKSNGDLMAAQRMFWRAIEALTESEFHMGKNDRHTAYNDWIDHLCKNPECFEKWMEKGMAA